jgi:hypothetical protein
MWHHFGEIDRIRDHPDLPLLLAQPLPPRVRAWIDEALGVVTQIASISISDSPTLEPVPSIDAVALVTTPSVQLTWSDWFDYVKSANKPAAEAFLLERPEIAIPDLSPSFIDALVTHLDEFYLDDALRARERALILQGLGEILHEYVRKPSFPRATLGSLYLTLFRLWGTLYAGTSIGQEHGHVLLELASAVLKLNLDPTLVRETLECWWQAKRSPSQIPFVLDAIELLERELPDTDAICNLWIDATDVIKRASDTLSTSERELWRRAGDHLGFDSETIAEYLPPDAELATEADPLAAINLNYVAIVCLREEQAEKAAKVIRERSGAQVDVITATTAGAETTHACHADVVIFVWMASTHAVFRAFDGFDRTRFCYVQGTGSSSIVRALERWTLYRL